MKKKDNKVARKEIQKERPRKKDQNRKEVDILAYAQVPKTKMKLNYFILLPCNSIKNLIFRHFQAKLAENWTKKEILLKKCFFFPLLIINIPYSKGYFLVLISTCMFTG